MIVEENFLIDPAYLPNEVCNQIIQRAKDLQDIEAITGDGLDTKIRNSRIVWLNDLWIYDWITPYVHYINNYVNWNFDIDHPEAIQFTKYKENQFYGWHQDILHKKESMENLMQRKISVVIPLSDSDEYEGGNLQFYDSLADPSSSKEKILEDPKTRTKGSIIIFPSYVHHQVTKVTKGERLSIVIWYKGPKWK